jgi:hypothetical protein
MVRFIRQEAEEKAAEIAVAAEEVRRKEFGWFAWGRRGARPSPLFLLHNPQQTNAANANKNNTTNAQEFNIEKLTMVDAATASLRREYERREAGAAVSGKVAASKAVSAARLTVLRAQDAALRRVVSSARARAAGLAASDPAGYERLLTDLAAQAVHALAGGGEGGSGGAGAGPVRLRVRPEDAAAGRAALAALPARYAALYGGAAPPPVQLDEAHPLPPGPPAGAAAGADDEEATAAAAGRYCAGGVVAVSADGRVSVPNTLDARLAIACEQTLPAVRAALFE